MKNFALLTTAIFILISCAYSGFALSLSQPESIVYDDSRGVYYISNVGTHGMEDGKIIIMESDGSLELMNTERFYDPKGMTIYNDYLFVVDLNEIIIIDLSTGKSVDRITVNEAYFMNDICSDGKGNLYITDTQQSIVFKFDTKAGTVANFNPKGHIERPNGIYFHEGYLYLVSYRDNSPVQKINTETRDVETVAATSISNLDGITRDRQGNFYISSWDDGLGGSGKIYRFNSDFSSGPEEIASGLTQPADIYFNFRNDTLCVPNMSISRIDYFGFPYMPDTPVLKLPENNSEGLGTSIVFRWNWSNGAYRYFLQISEKNDFSELFTEDTLDYLTYRQVEGLEPGKQYYWRVYTCNLIDKTPWSETWTFTTAEESIDAPDMISPENGLTNVARKPEFIWSRVECEQFRMQLSVDPEFNDAENIVQNDTIFVPENDLEASTEYFWRVRSENDGQDGPWSTVFSFTTETNLPGKPILLKPENSSTNLEPADIVFEWNIAENAIAYRLIVSHGIEMEELVLDTLFDNADAVSYTLKYPEEMAYYYWQVGAVNEDDVTEWSDVWVFTTTMGGAVDDNFAGEIQLKISPNPANEYLVIEYDNTTASSLMLTVADVNGNVIKVVDRIISNKTKIDIRDIQAGFYNIIIEYRNRSTALKLIKE